MHSIVFVIDANEYPGIPRKKWCKDVKHAVLKLLSCFSMSPPWKSSTEDNSADSSVKWAYRFMDIGSQVNYRTKQELKELTISEISLFEDEIHYYEEKADNQCDGAASGGAHLLLQELMSVVQDYNWERPNAMTPVKRKKCRFSEGRRKLHLQTSVRDFDSLSAASSGLRLPHNIVILLSPMPSTQHQLNTYFESNVLCAKDVLEKLMPPHLHLYFKKRHNITLLWVNTAPMDPVTLQTFARMDIINGFLKSISGSSIPIAALSSYKYSILDTSAHSVDAGEFSLCNGILESKNLTEIIPLSVLCGVIFKAAADVISEDNKHSIHVCHKESSRADSFCVKRLWTLSIFEKTVKVDILHQMCQFCTEPSQEKRIDTWCHLSLVSGDDTPALEVSTSKLNDLTMEVNTSTHLPETVFVICGRLSVTSLPFLLESSKLTGLHPVWCKIVATDTSIPSYFSPALRNHILTMKVHKYCTRCGREPSTNHCIVSQYAFLQIVNKETAFIIFLRSSSSKLIEMAQYESINPAGRTAAPVPSQTKTPNSSMRTIITKVSDLQPTSFHPDMMEKWWQVAGTFNSQNLLPSCKESKHQDTCTQSKIIENLRRHITLKHTKVKTELKTVVRGKSLGITECCADGNIVLILRSKYNKALEVEFNSDTSDGLSNFCILLMKNAHSIVSEIQQYSLKEENQSGLKLSQQFILNPNVMKRKVQEREINNSNEVVFQILLHMELASQFNSKREKAVEDICELLRLVSLSVSPSVTTTILRDILVKNYSSNCGEFLYEVHNELMWPIPCELEQYSLNESEATTEVFNLEPRAKTAASDPRSMHSCGGLEQTIRNPKMRLSSFTHIGRQIEIPAPMKKHKSNVLGNCTRETSHNIKHRLRSSAKKSHPNIDVQHADHIKRDLFSAMDEKKNDAKNQFSAGPCEKQMNLTVSDTPNVKKRMTALSRQRLRLRREKQNEEKESLTVVEESPAKQDDEVQLSASRKTKLMRRHSFYCDGFESRNLTRAKLKIHYETVPPTPVPVEKQKVCKYPGDAESPNGFSPLQNCFQTFQDLSSPSAMRARRSTMKALFQSPRKEKCALFDQFDPRTASELGTAETKLTSLEKAPEKFSFLPTSTENAVKEKNDKSKSPLWTKDPTNPDPGSCTMSPTDGVSLKVCDTLDEGEPSLALRDLRVADAVAETKIYHTKIPNKPVMLLDSFVIRTPVASRSGPPRQSPREKKKRKLFNDTTPTRDDINQWPRKKRCTDRSSPGVVSRKRQKLSRSGGLLRNDCASDKDPGVLSAGGDVG